MNHSRIAYITETSPQDKHAWSGTAHYVYAALVNHGYQVYALGPLKPGLTGLICRTLNQISLRIFNKRFDYRHSRIYSQAFGKLFSKKLKTLDYDLIVVCGATEYGAYLNTDKPVYYVLDRTIAGAIGYHTILSGLWKFSEQQSIETDKRAMLGAKKVFFSSNWAAQHAVQHYGLKEEQYSVFPFGANMDEIPDRETALKAKDKSEWRLLLVGTYWKNKGADIALNALSYLTEKGINARLTIVGCQPYEPIRNNRLLIIPFVDKNSPEGIKQLRELYLSHHFFILPTRFDCTPIVFCEASAFGVPVLSSDTGGVRGHVREGKNGFLLPFEDKGEGFANKIIDVISKPGYYEQLTESTRRCYEEELNWEAWVKQFEKEIRLS